MVFFVVEVATILLFGEFGEVVLGQAGVAPDVAAGNELTTSSPACTRSMWWLGQYLYLFIIAPRVLSPAQYLIQTCPYMDRIQRRAKLRFMSFMIPHKERYLSGESRTIQQAATLPSSLRIGISTMVAISKWTLLRTLTMRAKLGGQSTI